MKRYLSFSFSAYESNGGCDDLKLITNDFEEAMLAAKIYEYGHVLDLHEGIQYDTDGDIMHLRGW